jgi:hypothetical protein
MSDWRYTDSSQQVVIRTLDNGGMESCIATRPDVVAWVAAGNTILAAPAPPPDIAGSNKRLLINQATAHAAAGDLAAAVKTLIQLHQGD